MSRPWSKWQRSHLKVAMLLNSSEIRECVVCHEKKETVLATVHAYHEGGQHAPFLKISVCEDCLEKDKGEVA
jgi:hypothetical protein